MNPFRFHELQSQTRRAFLARSGLGLGSIALRDLMENGARAASGPTENPLAPRKPPLPAKAKSVIYLHMSGAPPTLDLFDYKPKLNELNMQDCPESLFQGKRFAFIKGRPKMLGHVHPFRKVGGNGLTVAEIMPHFMKIVDEVAVIRSLSTDQFNHAPGELMVHTGNMRPGSASIGSWVTYGLGSENADLPGFVVLLSGGTDPTGGKSLWNSGFLPSVYQGVQCRTSGEPILFSSDPDGMSRDSRRRTLDALAKLNGIESRVFGDPETLTRIAQYELAYRMQTAVPEVFDIRKEPPSILDLYGAKPGEGSFANNCLLARRLVENGVRYVQLYDWGWDMHGTNKENDLPEGLPRKCRDVDQAAAALVIDLKQRGLLENTLVVWGGEFGRTPMNEARGGSKFLGRDHHPNCFAMWMAGGGVKAGCVHGETDELGYDVAKDRVGVRDLQSTMLHLLGFDATRFSYRSQGLNNRLIGPTDEGRVVREILA
jgi:hypothetical protein